MDVIFHAADFDGLHFILPGDAAEKRPEPVAQFRLDERAAFLGAEDAMEIGADVGHGNHSAVPAGLWQHRILPGVETPGYCQSSLCDGQTALKFRDHQTPVRTWRRKCLRTDAKSILDRKSTRLNSSHLGI